MNHAELNIKAIDMSVVKVSERMEIPAHGGKLVRIGASRKRLVAGAGRPSWSFVSVAILSAVVVLFT